MFLYFFCIHCVVLLVYSMGIRKFFNNIAKNFLEKFAKNNLEKMCQSEKLKIQIYCIFARNLQWESIKNLSEPFWYQLYFYKNLPGGCCHMDLENLCEGDEGEQQPCPDEVVRHPVGSGLCTVNSTQQRNSTIFKIKKKPLEVSMVFFVSVCIFISFSRLFCSSNRTLGWVI
jgi:hypothetical protein